MLGVCPRLRLLAGLFFSAALLACDLPAPPDPPPSLTSRELVEFGHDLRAVELLTPVVEADPSNNLAAWLLSKSLTNLGRLDKALALAERTVAADPDNADYHVQLGAVLGRLAEKASIFKQLGLARRTRKELEAGLALDPKNLDGLYGLMLYYFAAPSFLGGDRAKAAGLADKIASVDAARGWMARASLAREQKDPAAQLDYARRAVAADPRNFDAQSELSQDLIDRPPADYRILEESACRLLELDPGRPDGWRALAELHVASRCWTELDQLLEAAEQFNRDDLSPYYSAAGAMLRLEERLPAARKYLEKYLSQPAEGSEATHAMARWQLAGILEKMQRTDEAVAQLEQAVQADPSLEEAKKDLKRLRGK